MRTNKTSEQPENELEERIRLSLLYDFYGALLKENQKRMFEAHVSEDYNLSEIAAEEGISRQGVHDAIKRATRQLEQYEAKLGLVKRFEKQKILVKKLQERILSLPAAQHQKEWSDISKILDELLDEV